MVSLNILLHLELCCPLKYPRVFHQVVRKQGPTLCKTEPAETTHPKHRDEKNPASADLIEAWE